MRRSDLPSALGLFRGRTDGAADGHSGAGADDGPTSVPAAVFLGPGTRSALVLLMLRLLRSGSVALIIVGAAVAVAFGRLDDETAAELGSLEGLVHALATPLVVLAAGIALRLLVSPLAYLAALAVVGLHRGEVSPAAERRHPFTRWRDRLRIVGGYQSLRWTVAVKHEAVDRLGATGRLLSWAEAGIWTVDVVAAIAFVVLSLR